MLPRHSTLNIVLFPDPGDHFKELEYVVCVSGGGRFSSSMVEEDMYIALSVKRHQHTQNSYVTSQFLPTSGKRISRKTVAMRLHQGRRCPIFETLP